MQVHPLEQVESLGARRLAEIVVNHYYRDEGCIRHSGSRWRLQHRASRL
jgi:hypothetical protein